VEDATRISCGDPHAPHPDTAWGHREGGGNLVGIFGHLVRWINLLAVYVVHLRRPALVKRQSRLTQRSCGSRDLLSFVLIAIALLHRAAPILISLAALLLDGAAVLHDQTLRDQPKSEDYSHPTIRSQRGELIVLHDSQTRTVRTANTNRGRRGRSHKCSRCGSSIAVLLQVLHRTQ
jgi:hypothetical protein